jgi:hypothetical protein
MVRVGETDFREVGRRYTELKRQYGIGSLNAEEFYTEIQQLMIRGDERLWWTKDPRTG